MENRGYLICEVGSLGGDDKERNKIYFVSFVRSLILSPVFLDTISIGRPSLRRFLAMKIFSSFKMYPLSRTNFNF